jgi:hypothetical protein
VRQHEPKTKEELKTAIEIEWARLTLKEINRVIGALRRVENGPCTTECRLLLITRVD